MERRIPLQDFVNDNGIIEHTYGYCDINSDGMSKPFTKKELDLHNFQVVFRTFLTKMILPNIPNLGPMINWKIVSALSQPLASISGPEDSSIEGIYLHIGNFMFSISRGLIIFLL